MAPRSLNRLAVKAAAGFTKAGMYGDGGGLYLRVKSAEARSWVFVFHLKGKRCEIGLGSFPTVSLLTARERAHARRTLVSEGIDPRSARVTPKQVSTFGELADKLIEDWAGSVRSDKSVARWKRCLGPGGYADCLRARPVDQIDTDAVLEALEPVWVALPSSAGLLRGYIERVLDVARVRGLRSGINPAAWKGHLALLLRRPKGLTRGHHKAMDYRNIPEFMLKLRAVKASAAVALQVAILTGCRTSEVLNAEWSEIDFDAALWTIPAKRMKAGREHRVPLVPLVVRLLGRLEVSSPYIFSGRSHGRPLSNMAMQMVLRRMGQDVTVHGFRSSFRDWAGDTTDAPREVAEAVLAHTIGNGAELAYRRGDALEKRRALMELWATYCTSRWHALRAVA